MEFTDRILKCVDCGEEFVFSAGEQLFFLDKGFQNEPRHCKKCKAKNTNARRTRRSQRHVLRVRRPHHRSVPATSRPAGLVPIVL